MIVTLYVVTFVTILRFLLPASVTYKEDISFTSINTNESETTERRSLNLSENKKDERTRGIIYL